MMIEATSSLSQCLNGNIKLIGCSVAVLSMVAKVTYQGSSYFLQRSVNSYHLCVGELETSEQCEMQSVLYHPLLGSVFLAVSYALGFLYSPGAWGLRVTVPSFRRVCRCTGTRGGEQEALW